MVAVADAVGHDARRGLGDAFNEYSEAVVSKGISRLSSIITAKPPSCSSSP